MKNWINVGNSQATAHLVHSARGNCLVAPQGTAPLADIYAKKKKNRTIPEYDLLLGQPRFVFNGVPLYFGQNKNLLEKVKCKGV